MIIPTYKPIGASTHLLAKKAGDIYQVKATHTGTLDPMADGVVIILTAKDRFKKSELTSWKKQYTFEVLWGISTDSHDLMGLTTKIGEAQIDDEKMVKILPEFTGSLEQQLPKFSAQRIEGKSYFDKAKEKAAFIPRSENIHIHHLELKNTYLIDKLQLQKQLDRINLVQGDFRQAEILSNWQQIIPNLPDKLMVTKFITTTSKKTYIRALVRDIAQNLGLPATTYSLTRTANGEFTIKNCICLI